MIGAKRISQAVPIAGRLAEDKSISNKILPHVRNQALAGRTSTLPATSWLRCKGTTFSRYHEKDTHSFMNH